MGKFSDYLDDIKNQTDTLREVVSEKSGFDCSELSIKGVADVVRDIQTGGKDPVLQEKSVDPKTYSQEVTADEGYDGLSMLSVGAVTSEIDVNILPNNIRRGVSILGVQGNLATDKPDQTKTVTPTTSRQEVVADTGYELGSVVVEAVNPSDYYKDEEIVNVTPSTESQKITPTADKVFNEVNVSAVTSAIDTNIVADNIKKDVTILGVTGTLETGGITPTGTINISINGVHNVSDYASANVNVPSKEPVLQEKTATENGEYVPDDGYDGLSKVVVNVVSSGSGSDMLQARIDATNNADYLFYNYTGASLDFIDKLKTNNVISFNNSFELCKNVTNIPEVDMSNATTAHACFSNCQNLKTISVKNSDNVMNMDYIFYLCGDLENISLNTDNCSQFQNGFQSCSSLKSVQLSKTNSVNNFSSTFYGCSELTNIQELDLASCNHASEIFYGCSNLLNINLVNTKLVSNFGYAFYNCTKCTTIKTIDLYNCTTTTSVNNIFTNCTSLKNLTLKNIRVTLKIGSSTTGYSLSSATILNTIKELWDNTNNALGGTKTLTIGSANTSMLSQHYVKLVDITEEMRAEDPYIDNKKPCVVCQGGDSGAMTMLEYVTTAKNWRIK